jgi:RNA polymerase sigma-70 factor, ECF subfamily
VSTPPLLPPETETALLRRAQDGDQAAFGELMRAHHEPVFRLVYAILHREHDARDVCQEIWLTVWKKLPAFRGDAQFSTWLHPIAVRRAIDHLRKRRRWFDRFLPIAADDNQIESAPEPVAETDTRATAEHTERRAALHAAIATLSPKMRAVLALREVQGLSYEAIAQSTGLPVGTVMSRLFHARRLLAQKLGDQS